ncbi:MAG: S41 family peptidase [Flavobacteriales bacterium]|jgi:carboxyl-terminal processing protease|nr:S41 family peptidase [Flavobacteriales bacterium]MBT6013665.1 S41 family peptidase [Flavobacteriales bacterium]MBT7480777.1 S41 family peptidase [Flavobacteriales bacterium]
MNNTLKKISAILLIGLLPFIAIAQTTNYFETSKNLEIFTDLFKELDMYYVDEVNSGDLMKTAIDEMLTSLDPYTTYIPESDIEDYRFMTTGQYGGIGAMITKRKDFVYISEPYEGFPAQKAGLMAGDKIIEVNGKSAKGKTTEELSKILKGQPNTEVSILIERKGQEPFVVNFKREKVTVKSVPYYGFLENGIAYIKLRSFTRDCSNDIKNALTDLKTQQELKGIILDLRSNPGGLLNESIDIVNLFVEKGENIVITKGKIKDWEKTYKARYFPEDKETPLIILINQNSASASEIVSGAIQDLDRGVVVGKRSYGKGLVQQTRKLSYNSQLKVTVAKYYIPSGRCIQALDYSNRNKDGSVGKIPDSLISTFKTRNGREVKDGGGIIPDVKVKQDVISDITISIIRERLIFDYATDFRLENDSIISADNFEITDNEFEKFTSYLKDKEYKYTTATEDALEIFKEIAEEEKSFYEIEEQYNLLSSQIKNNKENDLSKNKEELKEFLSDEIVSRYFYQEGRIINRLKYDKEVKEAINILHDLNRYNEILNKTDE